MGCSAAHAFEHVTLRNGFSLDCVRHEAIGDRIRLYTGDTNYQELASAEIALHRTEYPGRDLCILDILPAGCSKASALERLAELRGISLQQVLAIGDNWNDLPMLEAAGQTVLMSNAPEALKELAGERGWTIGHSNDEDGVAVAIETALNIVSAPGATEKPVMVV